MDTNNEEIHFFQCKIRQKETGTIGDVNLKTFVASVGQFDSAEKVDAIFEGRCGCRSEGSDLRLEVRDLLGKGYRPIAVYVTNECSDDASKAYAGIEPSLKIYDRKAIAENFIDADQGAGVIGAFKFDLGYVEPLVMATGTDVNGAKV